MQLRLSQVTAGTWYLVKDHLPPDDIKVVVSNGEDWIVGYMIGEGTAWVWYMKNNLYGTRAWQVPALPNKGLLGLLE